VKAQESIEHLPKAVEEAGAVLDILTAQEAINEAKANIAAVVARDEEYDTAAWDKVISEQQNKVNGMLTLAAAILEARAAVNGLPESISAAGNAENAQKAIDAVKAKIAAVVARDAEYNTAAWDDVIAKQQAIVDNMLVLETAIAEAEVKKEADYTAESWINFTNLYNTARGMPETTNQEIIDKTNAINEAIAKLVTHLDAFNNAITNAVDGGTITLTGNVIANGIIEKLVNLDLKGYTLIGNVSISSDSVTPEKITISAGTIDGNLTVYTPNATVNNSATVTGETNITAVSESSFISTGKHDKGINMNGKGKLELSGDASTAPVTVNTTDRVILAGTINNVTLQQTGNLTVQAENTVITIPENAQVNGLVINAPVTIISPEPIQATIANGVAVTVKVTKDVEGRTITGTDDNQPVTVTTDTSVVVTKDELISALQNGIEAITLGRNITLNATLKIDRAVTIDGNGKTISGAFFNVASGAVTFENIKFQGTGSLGSQDAIQVQNGASATVRNCIFEGLYRGINAYFDSTITVQNNTFTDVYRCIIAGMGPVIEGKNVKVEDISGNTFNLGFAVGTKYARGISYNTDSKQGKDTLSAAVSYMLDKNTFGVVEGDDINLVDLDHKVRYYSGYQSYVNHPLADGTITTDGGGATVTVLNGTASGVIPTIGDQRELVLGKITVGSSGITVADLMTGLTKADFVDSITVKDSSGNAKTEETIADGDRVYIKSKDGKETDYYIIEI